MGRSGSLPSLVGLFCASLTPVRQDVVEGPNDFKLSTDVPGLSKSDIKVVLEDNVLRLSGERRRCETKEGEGWKRSERSYGMFERRFRVPPNTDPLGAPPLGLACDCL